MQDIESTHYKFHQAVQDADLLAAVPLNMARLDTASIPLSVDPWLRSTAAGLGIVYPSAGLYALGIEVHGFALDGNGAGCNQPIHIEVGPVNGGALTSCDDAVVVAPSGALIYCEQAYLEGVLFRGRSIYVMPTPLTGEFHIRFSFVAAVACDVIIQHRHIVGYASGVTPS